MEKTPTERNIYIRVVKVMAHGPDQPTEPYHTACCAACGLYTGPSCQAQYKPYRPALCAGAGMLAAPILNQPCALDLAYGASLWAQSNLQISSMSFIWPAGPNEFDSPCSTSCGKPF